MTKASLFSDGWFCLLPHVFCVRFTGERARYFGYTWAICLHWLWWEVEIIGT